MTAADAIMETIGVLLTWVPALFLLTAVVVGLVDAFSDLGK